MKSYVVDEISPSDMEKIDDYLRRMALQSPLERFYWVELPADLLSSSQAQHLQCRPHVFSVELGSDQFRIEFFIRSLNRMNCTCQAYCTPRQRAYILETADAWLADLHIRT